MNSPNDGTIHYLAQRERPGDASFESRATVAGRANEQVALWSNDFVRMFGLQHPYNEDAEGLTVRRMPEKVGRYLLLHRIGAGAMGVVHAAYDPKLDRKVAIKLVDLSRIGTDVGDAHVRLEREAQAAATLSHPNIVTVYDVGHHLDGAFMAMEFVEGTTLSRWLADEKRGWREILRMFVELGRGLQAAHDHGMVHRDFKPSNVLVGTDGRPRIADFGLACPVEGWSARQLARSASGASSRALTIETGSRGDICGTPSYMAPEQYRGADIGPRSDQFAFAVTLFEALYGVRPFTGPTTSHIAEAVLAHRVQIPRGRQAFPPTVARIVARGMAHRPDARFESVAAMTGALERVVGQRKRRIAVGSISAISALTLGLGYQIASAQHGDPCENVTETADALWTDDARMGVQASLATANWSERFAELEHGLDAYLGDWRAHRVEVCQAARVEETQSEHALQLQFACLDRALVSFEAVVDELRDAADPRTDPTTSTELLVELDECRDLDRLARYEDGSSAAQSADDLRPRLEAWKALSRARARMNFGKDGWPALASEALAIAQEHGFSREEASANVLLGASAQREGKLDEAETRFRSAVEQALAGDDTTLAVSAMLRRADVALAAGRSAEGRVHLDYVLAAMSGVRSDAQAEHLRRDLALLEGRAAHDLGHYGDAASKLERAAEIAESGTWSRDPEAQGQLATLYGQLGVARAGAAQFDAAVVAFERALALFEGLESVDPKLLADTRQNLALCHIQMHAFGRAEDELRLAEQLYAEAKVHPAVLADLTSNWGWLERERGRLGRAAERQRAALAMYDAALPPEHPARAVALVELAQIARLEGEWSTAMDAIGKAGQLRTNALGPTHPQTAYALTVMAWILADKGDYEAANGPLGEAQRIFAAAPDGNRLDALTARYVAARLELGRDVQAGQVALSEIERELDDLGAAAQGLEADLMHFRVDSD